MKTVLHGWDLSYGDAVSLQQRLAGRLFEQPIDLGAIKTVAGVDVSSSRRSKSVHAAVVVLDTNSFRLIEEATASLEASMPYIPGLLSFREGPAALAAFNKLADPPDAVIFDGQGYAHPRRFGLAAHIGLWLGLPTVGCAKTRLVGEYKPPQPQHGSWSALVDKGETIGAVVVTRQGVKPVFVSRGQFCDLSSAVELVLACCSRYRLPEPIRRAHKLCNEVRKARENSRAGTNFSTIESPSTGSGQALRRQRGLKFYHRGHRG